MCSIESCCQRNSLVCTSRSASDKVEYRGWAVELSCFPPPLGCIHVQYIKCYVSGLFNLINWIVKMDLQDYPSNGFCCLDLFWMYLTKQHTGMVEREALRVDGHSSGLSLGCLTRAVWGYVGECSSLLEYDIMRTGGVEEGKCGALVQSHSVCWVMGSRLVWPLVWPRCFPLPDSNSSVMFSFCCPSPMSATFLSVFSCNCITFFQTHTFTFADCDFIRTRTRAKVL